MKIAALSDIHGNVYALRAVLADVRRRGTDTLVNLGDILYGPVAPRATYDLLMEQAFVTIRGNQDRQIYEAGEVELAANPTLRFVREDLGREPLEWMRSLPFDARLDEVHLCHGTPDDDLVYLIEDVADGHPRVRPEADILRLLNGLNAPLILCGHSHTPRTVQLDNGPLIVNPGSVGLPAYADDEPVRHAMETFSPHASYAVLERSAQGWTVEHVKVPYDHHAAARDAARRGRPDWVHCLTSGRAA
ncbi:MAG: metallophosphoesterase family protein [Acidihalobacter sp.]